MPTDPPPSAGTVLEVDLDAIAANWRTLRDRHQGEVGCVVKADAYGLGARAVAARLFAAGGRHFFTAHLNEALAIRARVPGAMLAVLNGLIPGAEPEYLAHDLTPVLGSLADIAAWAQQAAQAGRELPAILHVDTGMHRLGLDAGELAVLAQDHGRLRGIRLRYVMTHLVSAEIADDPLNARQRARFAAACAALPAAPRSLANSSGIFLDGFGSDLARPGAALYGINPTPGRPNPMQPAVRLLARVLQVRDVPQGEGVGYNAAWIAPRPSRIATVAAGYADGWHRALSGRGTAAFDGAPVPLVGRISMDLTTFDVTGLAGIAPGAWLELIGPHCPAEAVAEAAGTNAYEILTSLGRRSHLAYKGA